MMPNNQTHSPAGSTGKHRFFKDTAAFSLLTVFSRITGVLRASTFVAVLGSGVFYDAYNVAEMIPFMLYEVVVGGLLTAVFLPLLVRVQEQYGKSSKEAWHSANLLLGGVAGILSLVALLVIIFAPALISLQTLFVPASKNADFIISVTYLRWFAPEIALFGMCAVCMSILNSHGKFVISGAAPIISNLFMIMVLLCYAKGLFKPEYLALGATCGIAMQLFFMFPALKLLGMPIRPIIDFRDPIFKFISTVAPGIAFLSIANFLSTMVRTNLLAPLDGGVSAYKNCYLLVMTPYGIIAVSIITVLTPTLSRHSANNRLDEFRSTLSLGLRTTFVIMMPIMVGAILLAKPIITLLYERGLFTPEMTEFNAHFLMAYSTIILPYAIVMFLTKAFFAAKNTFSPVAIGVLGAFISIILGFIGVQLIGAYGVAIASGCAYAITAVLSLYIIRRYCGTIDGRNLFSTSVKSTIAAIIMGVAVYGALQFFENKVGTQSVATLVSGESSRIKFPAFDKSGQIIPISTQKDMNAALHLMMGDTVTSKPEYVYKPDLKYNLAIAPASRTTTTLQVMPKSIIPGFHHNRTSISMHEAKTTCSLEERHAWILYRSNTNSEDETVFNKPRFLNNKTVNYAVIVTLCTMWGMLIYGLMAHIFKLKEIEFITRRIFRHKK